jgi:hypothetical protein
MGTEQRKRMGAESSHLGMTEGGGSGGHDPYANVRNYAFENVRPGVGASHIACTSPGCNWKQSTSGMSSGEPVEAWTAHARAAQSEETGEPWQMTGVLGHPVKRGR